MNIVLMLQNSDRWLSRHKVKYPGIEEILSKYTALEFQDTMNYVAVHSHV
jgi:hypothetical protein